jgi:hypothetical protein
LIHYISNRELTGLKKINSKAMEDGNGKVGMSGLRLYL